MLAANAEQAAAESREASSAAFFIASRTALNDPNALNTKMSAFVDYLATFDVAVALFPP